MRRIGLAMAILGASAAVAQIAGAGGGPRTELTSRGPNGATEGTSTYWRSLSGSGRLAVFTSDDDSLPGEDATKDVYVRNLNTDKTELVSRSSSGEPADDDSGDDPAISGKGRFVAFSTDAENLPGGEGGIYVRDLKRNRTSLVSRTSAGDPSITNSWGRPELSADGRLVSFELDDDAFPGADGTLDVYVRDRKRGKTSLASRASDGTPADSDASFPQISGNGRFVVFRSDSDVLPGDDATNDVFIRDRKRGATSLVTRTPAGDPVGGGLTHAGAVSFNGRRVVFVSGDPDLGGDPSGTAFVRDRKRGTTKPVSLTDDDQVAIGDTASISANGRFVAYESEDDDLPGTDGGVIDVFRYDLKAKKTVLVSRATNGDPGDDDSFYASISGSGSYVALTSRAENFSDAANIDLYGGTYVRGPMN